MWRERLKGIVVIALVGGLVYAAARYWSQSRHQFENKKIDLSPAVVEQRVLGAIHYFSGKDTAQLQQELRAPIKEIEKKALELFNQFKNFPQREVQTVKNQVLGPVCEGVASPSSLPTVSSAP